MNHASDYGYSIAGQLPSSEPDDRKCHNAQRGTYGHECGKPATWIGTKPNGFRSGFCDWCKEHGHEARPFTHWERIET